MQLRVDDQIVTCRGGCVSKKVDNRFAWCCEVREKEECSEGPRNVTICWSVAEGCIAKSAWAPGFREDSPVNELVMHRQKVMPGCVFPYADLPQAGRPRRSCTFVCRFPQYVAVLRWQGEGCNPARSKRSWPLEFRQESLMLWASS